jgi:hypothetical protein
MKNLIYFLIAWILYVIIHEGIHVIAALPYGEFHSIIVHWYGPQVIFNTPVAEREGVMWGFISGTPNIITLALGYTLFLYRGEIKELRKDLIHILEYVIIIFMLADAFNLSLAPFFVGGDINGLVECFGINRYLIQFFFFAILLVSRELIAQKLLPEFGIKTKHFLFRKWINLKLNK